VLVLTVSCSKNDDGGTQTVTPFVANINGQQFLPTAIPSAQMSSNNRFIIINAINTVTSQTVTLSIGSDSGTSPALTTGPYPITNGGNSISYFVDNNSFISDAIGQIVITALDTDSRTISGTFEGSVTGTFGSNETFTFSNGEFTNITYSLQ